VVEHLVGPNYRSFMSHHSVIRSSPVVIRLETYNHISHQLKNQCVKQRAVRMTVGFYALLLIAEGITTSESTSFIHSVRSAWFIHSFTSKHRCTSSNGLFYLWKRSIRLNTSNHRPPNQPTWDASYIYSHIHSTFIHCAQASVRQQQRFVLKLWK
jgi:hypothetical protein